MRRGPLGVAACEVSELGFGASPLGAVYGAFAEQDGIDAVHAALDLGVTFFDVSPYYGATAAETVLGKALLLRDVEECLGPVGDVGWPSGRPENQQPGGRHEPHPHRCGGRTRRPGDPRHPRALLGSAAPHLPVAGRRRPP